MPSVGAGCFAMTDRIERLRNQDLNDLVDRAIPEIASGTLRRLVCVYNGGAMPSEPDHFYLTNPAYVNGAETEGGIASLSVDASQTIIVDVIGKAPLAGDFLTAYAIGGRWVAKLTGAQPSTGCIQFLGCNSQPLQGVIVNIYSQQGGTLLAGPLATDGSGKICPGLDSGTYWVDTTETSDQGFPLNLYVWTAQNFAIPAGGAAFWPVMLKSGYGCCATVAFPLPMTLFLTVCGQTFTLVSGSATITGWAPRAISPTSRRRASPAATSVRATAGMEPRRRPTQCPGRFGSSVRPIRLRQRDWQESAESAITTDGSAASMLTPSVRRNARESGSAPVATLKPSRARVYRSFWPARSARRSASPAPCRPACRPVA